MKPRYHLCLLFVIIFAVACSGSDVYRGAWKATDAQGRRFDIMFYAKRFTITDQQGRTTSYSYTQHTIKIQNGVKTYGIRLSDGRDFYIYFPLANDASKAIIKLWNYYPVYTISRSSYTQYTDLYKLTD